jgi:hypothetical protein
MVASTNVCISKSILLVGKCDFGTILEFDLLLSFYFKVDGVYPSPNGEVGVA